MPIAPNVSRIEKQMYKSWIQANPEIALLHAEQFLKDVTEAGMTLRYVETEHLVYIIGAYDARYLAGDYA